MTPAGKTMATKKHTMHKRALRFLCFLVAVTGFGQAPGFEGTWYGAISPPGAKFDVAVNVQRRGEVWTGTLLLEDGTSFQLTDISVKADAITFSVSPGPTKVTFTGTLSATPSITGEFKQDNATFPFSLSRTPTGAFQGAAVAFDPNELISMMASFSGPASERPFVPPITHPAIEYGIRPRRDPVANLQRDIEEGKVQLKFEGEDGYLRSVLEALRVPVESQMAVFSKNSLQSPLINPENPRVLYFNDSVAVASVRGGFIELASQDPEQGINFYMLPQQPAGKPFILQRDRDCLRCHQSRNSLDIPGMLLRSVYPTAAGAPINQLGSHLLDHRTKFEQRWGGWFVSGNSGSMRHLGNSAVTDPEKPESMTAMKTKYPSDIVALMVFQHQMHLMNLITRVGWEFRIAASLEQATGKRNEAVAGQLQDATNELVDYLLFVDEAPLTGRIQGSSGFAEKFAAQGPLDSKGRSLRQFDLERRMMKYPCSYMVYSPAFDALPAAARKSIYERMLQVMSMRFDAADRRAVIEILRETKKDLPEGFVP
jgi:hypothetical protein